MWYARASVTDAVATAQEISKVSNAGAQTALTRAQGFDPSKVSTTVTADQDGYFRR
jgi:hypothetical protein